MKKFDKIIANPPWTSDGQLPLEITQFLINNIDCNEFVNYMPITYYTNDLSQYKDKAISVSEQDDICYNLNDNMGSIIKIKGGGNSSISNDKEKIVCERFNQWFKNKINIIGEKEFYLNNFHCYLTTPKTVFKMIQQFNNIDGTIIDPCMGYGGNLLAGMIMCGADPKKIYGIELNPQCYLEAVRVLTAMGVPKNNLHLGNCLDINCYDFENTNYTYPYDNISKQYFTTFLKQINTIDKYKTEMYNKGKDYKNI